MLKCVWLLCIVFMVNGRDLMSLYHPKDITKDCAFSHHLRYDLSFGKEMTDSITLVLRNLKEIDYECSVEILTENVFLLIIIRFPNLIAINCGKNAEAFTVLKNNECTRICDQIDARDTNSPYFSFSVSERIILRFLSNSSINTNLDADSYQITATAARSMPKTGCDNNNETICIINEENYCFTSVVVCDGIKNCGVTDWFDEKKTECKTSVEGIGLAPVIAITALIFCITVAASHLLLQCLPPLANSFFIFNANEDNRLCLDSVFETPDIALEMEHTKKKSLIPISSSSSEDNCDIIALESERLSITKTSDLEEKPPKMGTKPSKEVLRKTAMNIITNMLQQRLRSVVGGGRSVEPKVDEFQT